MCLGICYRYGTEKMKLGDFNAQLLFRPQFPIYKACRLKRVSFLPPLPPLKD